MKYTMNKPTKQTYSLIGLTILVLVCVSRGQQPDIDLKPYPGNENQTMIRERGVRNPVTLQISYYLPTGIYRISINYYKTSPITSQHLWHTDVDWSGHRDPVNKGMSGYSVSPNPSKTSHSLSIDYPDLSDSGMYDVQLFYWKKGILDSYNAFLKPKMYLDIHTPPQFTLMINYNASNVVNEGNAASLRCTTPEFYPLKVNASIFIAGVKNGCEPSTSWTSDWPRSLCERSETFAREENQEVTIECRAEWNGQPPIRWPLVVLNVTFPASRVKMTQPFPAVPVTVGSRLTIICETDTANPIATIIWTIDGAQLVERENYTVTSTKSEGEYNGKKTSSTLSFSVTLDEHGKEFECSILGNDAVTPQRSTLMVQDCATGTNGSKCQFQCPQFCLDGCTQNGTCILCQPGFYGDQCEACSEGCVLCGRHDGLCTECAPNYYPNIDGCVKCSQNCKDGCKDNGDCKKCIMGYYGLECESPCHFGCMNNLCTQVGVCVGCQSGLMGDKCKENCPVGCKTSCEQSGTCNKCVDGFFGANCESTCRNICANECTKMKGYCIACANSSRSGPDCNICENGRLCSEEVGDKSEVQGKPIKKLTAVHIALICIASIIFVMMIALIVYGRPSKVAQEEVDLDELENVQSTGEIQN